MAVRPDTKRAVTDDRADERRVEPRYIACFPAHVQRETGSTRSAIIHDISVTGVLLLTRARLEIGEAVTLKLYLDDTSRKPRVAPGRVVRMEERGEDRAEVWPFSVGVQLDEPIDDCAVQISDLEARQKAIGLPRD